VHFQKNREGGGGPIVNQLSDKDSCPEEQRDEGPLYTRRPKVPTLSEGISPIVTSLHLCVITSVVRSPKGGSTKPNLVKDAKMNSYLGGDSVSTEAVAARRHAGTHLPVTWWKLEMPTTTWHLLLN